MKHFLLVLMLAAIPASAQWRHFGGSRGGPGQGSEPTAYFGIGAAAPLNPLGRTLDTGFTLQGGVGVTRPYVGVMFDTMFTNFGLNNNALVQAGARRGSQKYWGLTIDPIFHVNQRGPVDFYVTGGGGLYGEHTNLRTRFTTAQSNFDLVSTDNRYGPGVDGGAGFSFNLTDRSRLKFFAEARYHHMFLSGKDANFIPVTIGVRF